LYEEFFLLFVEINCGVNSVLLAGIYFYVVWVS